MFASRLLLVVSVSCHFYATFVSMIFENESSVRNIDQTCWGSSGTPFKHFVFRSLSGCSSQASVADLTIMRRSDSAKGLKELRELLDVFVV